MREKLVELRKKAGLTQREMAGLVGISTSFYGLIELKLRNPSYGLAKKIAKQLGGNVEEIFFDIDAYRMKS